MGRPEYSSRPGTTSQSGISAWFQRRKDRKKEAAEIAAKMITDDTAKNELAIINTLRSVDFLHSKLPREVLDHKENPNRNCGDLEFASRVVCSKLIKNPQTLAVDMRKIDERLLTIAVWFKQSVEQGDERAAYAAKGALARGINDIRSRVPLNDPALFTQYVEANARYLDSWITLIGIAQVTDRLKENVEEQKKRIEDKREESQAKREQMKAWFQDSNSAEGKTLAYVLKHDSPEERMSWTPEQKEMQKRIIEDRLDDVRLLVDGLLLEEAEKGYASKNNQVEILYSKVASQVVVCDPDLMNKFREDVDDMFKSLAASDAEFDETMRAMEDIEGRVMQLYTSPGSQRAAAIMEEQVKKMAEEIKQKQLAEGDTGAKELEALRDRFGIMSVEEEENLKRQAAIEQQRVEQELYEEVSEEELNYN